MNDIMLIAINPEYVERILDGSKKYEFRTRYAKRNPKYMVIYCTAPVCKVVAVAGIKGILVEGPEYMWERTHEYAGIGKDKFLAYFKGREFAYAYEFESVHRLEQPLPLEEFGYKYPPQSFNYVKEGQIPETIKSLFSKEKK